MYGFLLFVTTIILKLESVNSNQQLHSYWDILLQDCEINVLTSAVCNFRMSLFFNTYKLGSAIIS